MSEHDGKPANERGVVLAENSVVVPEMVSPPLSPGEAPAIGASKTRIADPEVSEAEVIMLPAKFAAFLATTATRFHERSRALPAAGRRAAAVAVVMLIAGASAVGGAVLNPFAARDASERNAQAEHMRAVRQSVARIESELASMRNNIDRTAKLSAAQAGKTGDRLDRIEKGQAEPAARLAKLADSVEKLRVTPPVTVPAIVPAQIATPAAPPAAVAAATAAAAPVAPTREATGSISVQASVASPKVEAPAKPAIVEGWVLRDAERDAALIEGRNGLMEVFAGDTIPGIGRVESVRRHEGKWAVVTAKGLIVAR